MEKQLLDHINRHALFTRQDHVLLAVSGGIDSMVMLDLFQRASFKIGVAHCNFQLRGDESDADEVLVKKTAEMHGIAFHATRFETEKYARENGLSIQLAARELRYHWFDGLIAQHGYSHLATAHHLNDSLETMLLNLVRGTGLEGVTGIPVRRGNVIRPLLFATRDMITAYASAHQLTWREDRSNSDTKYQRNLVRNKIIPLLKVINPSLERSMENTLERLQGSWGLVEKAVRNFCKEAVKAEGNRMRINKEMLCAQPQASLLLWEILKKKGFNFEQCASITGEQHQSGKVFYSPSHCITIDRDFLLVDRQKERFPFSAQIDGPVGKINAGNFSLTCSILERDKFVLRKDNTIAQLDAGKIKFPLTWRTWQAGDHFVPLGMEHSKKISDFLIDEKVSLPDKEHITVIESGGEIAWLAGRRIADSFKVTDQTRQVLVLSMSVIC